jgi:hypothetical protein
MHYVIFKHITDTMAGTRTHNYFYFNWESESLNL